MNFSERSRIASEVNEAGRCSHPIRLNSTQINVVTGEVNTKVVKIACKDRREAVCPACSRTYGTDAWIVAATGINGGKGVPADVVDCPRIFVTMTAPSFGSVHTVRSNGRCVRDYSVDLMCEHGWPKSCGLRHGDSDPLLGLPICDRCFRYRDAVLWNAHASRLWSATVLRVRRNLASRLGVSRTDLSRRASVHYLKVAEMQRRGLVHFHSLARLESADGTVIGTEELVGAWSDAVRETALSNELGRFQWGVILDIKTVGSGREDARVLASYLAKYVTKTAGDGLELARKFYSRRQIRILVDNPHLRRMALQAWDLALESKCAAFNPKAHAHNLGYTGQLMTKSRRYSTTFTALRRARSDHRAGGQLGEVAVGNYSYAGRGYDDVRSGVLADLLANMERDNRLAQRKGPNKSRAEAEDLKIE